MHQRFALYVSAQSCSTGTYQELVNSLRQTVENRGETVVATFADDGAENRPRQRNSGWKALVASLDSVDQVAVASAGDLPGKTAKGLTDLDGIRQLRASVSSNDVEQRVGRTGASIESVGNR
jgi:hypothetical protein